MQSSENITVEIRDGVIYIGEDAITLPSTHEILVKIVGEHSRAVMLFNAVFVWDHLGLFARTNDGSDITSIGFVFNDYNAQFTPKEFFKGKLTIDGHSYRSDLSANDFPSFGYNGDAPPDFWGHKSGDASLQAVLVNGVFSSVTIENHGIV